MVFPSQRRKMANRVKQWTKSSKLRKIARGKTSANQVLAREIKRIKKRLNREHQVLNYGQTFSSGVSADVTYYKLCGINGWSPIFGTNADDGNDSKAQHISVGVDMYLSLENTINEPDTTEFTIFIVSLTDNMGQNFTPADGNISLVSNLHYYVLGGLVMLNKKCFNIHYVKRVVLTNHGTTLSEPSAQTQGGTDWRKYVSLKINKTITNPYGDWDQLVCPPDPSHNYYVLVFNNNSTLDLQNPLMRINTVHTIKTIA